MKKEIEIVDDDKNNDKEQIYDKNEILRSLGFSAPEKI